MFCFFLTMSESADMLHKYTTRPILIKYIMMITHGRPPSRLIIIIIFLFLLWHQVYKRTENPNMRNTLLPPFLTRALWNYLPFVYIISGVTMRRPLHESRDIHDAITARTRPHHVAGSPLLVSFLVYFP